MSKKILSYGCLLAALLASNFASAGEVEIGRFFLNGDSAQRRFNYTMYWNDLGPWVHATIERRCDSDRRGGFVPCAESTIDLDSSDHLFLGQGLDQEHVMVRGQNGQTTPCARKTGDDEVELLNGCTIAHRLEPGGVVRKNHRGRVPLVHVFIQCPQL